MLLAEFRTSVNLTGFHVFALMHVFAQVFYFCTGGDAFSRSLCIFPIALSYTPVAAMCFLPNSHLGEFDRLSCVRTYARIRTDILFSYVTHSHKK